MAAAPRWCLQLAVRASLLVLLLAADAPPPQAGSAVTLHADDPTQVGYYTTRCVLCLVACWVSLRIELVVH